MNAFDGGIELVECPPERSRQWLVASVDDRCVGSKNSEIQFAVEERDAQTRGGQPVSMGPGLALNQAAETETSQIVGHLRGGIRPTEQRRDARAQVAVPKARDDVSKAAQRLTEGLDARVAKPQRGDPNAPEIKRML